MTEKQWQKKFADLNKRVKLLENVIVGRSMQVSRVPKRLPFRDETPLANIVKVDARIQLCSTIDSWRPLLSDSKDKRDLEISRFDFNLSAFPYEKFYTDISQLISQNCFTISTNMVAWYFILHSNLPLSHYSLYTTLLNYSKQQTA